MKIFPSHKTQMSFIFSHASPGNMSHLHCSCLVQLSQDSWGTGLDQELTERNWQDSDIEKKKKEESNLSLTLFSFLVFFFLETQKFEHFILTQTCRKLHYWLMELSVLGHPVTSEKNTSVKSEKLLLIYLYFLHLMVVHFFTCLLEWVMSF